MPELDDVWFNKETNEPVLVLFVSGYRLTYQKGSGKHAGLSTTNMGEFLDMYQKDEPSS